MRNIIRSLFTRSCYQQWYFLHSLCYYNFIIFLHDAKLAGLHLEITEILHQVLENKERK